MANIDNPRYPSAELLADPRNVIDHFKYWSTEAIKANCDARRMPLAVAVENAAYDFNIGSVVRNANAFLAREVTIIGRRSWDRRGAVGAHHYESLRLIKTVAEAIASYREEGYRVVAFDNHVEAVSLLDYHFDERTLLLFGQESIGLSPAALSEADDVVFIPQFGATRSLNVGVASGIAMFAYMQQHGQARPPLPSEA